MRANVALRLGRVSNLPTVWSNVLVGMVLAGSVPAASAASLPDAPSAGLLLLLITALSMLYIGGMFLNDAFDRNYDARFRPERPIPAGEVSARVVFVAGFALLSSGIVLVALASAGDWHAPGSALLLAGAIILYNAWHKGNPLSPLLMGACRALVYITAGVALAAPPSDAVVIAAGITLCYLIGLSYAAKQENLLRLDALWPLAFLAVPLAYGVLAAGLIGQMPGLTLLISALLLFWLAHCVRRLLQGGAAIGRGVAHLLAGISLVDALILAANGAGGGALLALCAFLLTLALQRRIAGT